MTGDDDLYRLIALNAYAAYRNCLSGMMSALQKHAFDRLSHPEPGDLVLEITTLWSWWDRPDGTPGAALGSLIRIADEPILTQEALDALHAQGETFRHAGETLADLPTDRVYYIQPLDARQPPLARWANADFIRCSRERPASWEAVAEASR